MFHLQPPDIRFENMDKCSKGLWGQSSPKVIQGHHRSLSAKNKNIVISHKVFNF